MSGEHEHCPVCGDDMCEGKYDAKSRTCRECKHFRPRDPDNGPFWDVCKCPIPPWAEHSDNVLGVHNTDMFAQSCPCYEPKETTP
jgi:hypothetical protein